MNQNKVIEQLSLRSFGAKGWMSSSSCECPLCHRSDKFGIKFIGNGGTVHCFYDDFCESLSKYLRRIGRGDLVEKSSSVSIEVKIKGLDQVSSVMETVIPEIPLPMRFVRTYKDPYLENRGFLKQHYDLFQPGYSEDPLLKDYIIFQMFQFGRRVGIQSRTRLSKEWHKKNLEDYKKGLCKLKLRFKDSAGMDTSMILGGCDDITEKTDTLILVEGIFDKVGVDRKLELYSDESTRCCFTFGNKIGDGQIKVISKFKNIRRIFSLYDLGTINQIKKIALQLSKKYEVFAAVMPDENDPGDADEDIIWQALAKSMSAIDFYSKKIENKIF